MFPVTKVAIAGLSGKIGSLIAQSLLKHHPTVQINGIVRSPSKVATTIASNSNVHIHQADPSNPSALRKALANVDVCICCYLGDNELMVQGQKTLIDACIAEKVPRYIGSDYSFDFRGLKKGDHPAKDFALEYNAYLEENEKEGKIKGVHILNGGFTEVIFSPFLGWFNGEGNGKFTYFGTGDEKLDMTTMKDTAAFTAEVAMDENANGYLNVVGDRKSVKELAKVYEEVYGVTPEVQRRGSFEDLHKIMRETFQKDPSNIFAWMGMHYQYYMGKGSVTLGKDENERLGDRKPQGVKEFLQSWPRERVAMSYMS
ncbi:hypothetical protein M409DRAFT_57066 [Zasmidium cellare ATCC 36951]|uniref:NmrA-like domain-containing protein n=1 Tax=Zasmidium cellare ATCC 36951 TaxID=1080233 RepID=A0A6A6CDF7_ZASCE|nr:uncharacterized protein M409DRAFT_57066 [Zasmidium cellare ATCC 36951]KAF2163962.1 hypothetical protein M409DRAFT_57066 [Zasmidium cellare ATCC 36951]